MVFQFLVDIVSDEGSLGGVVVPSIVMNKLPRGCKSIKIVNYKKAKIVVSLQQLGVHTVRLSGEQWAEFLKSFEDEDITTLCFSMIKKCTFEVCCFNTEGFELRSHESGEDAIYSCLVKATENTFVQQDLAPVFLWQVTHNERRTKTLNVTGSNQDSNVDVVYVGADSNNKRGNAAGFSGPKWTTFCLENEVEPGYYMRFTNLGNYKFNLQVFNKDGVGLDIPDSPVDHSVLPVESVDIMTDDEDVVGILSFSHRCSHEDHPHNSLLPQFFSILDSFTLERNMLTIPRPFVRMYDIQSYKNAVLHFGRMKFIANLHVKIDRRQIDDSTHVVLITNWTTFLEETGVTVGKVSRFQLNVHKCVAGQTVDFDIC